MMGVLDLVTICVFLLGNNILDILYRNYSEY